MSIDWAAYKRMVAALPFGKKLPTAVYIHRRSGPCLAGPLAQLLAELAAANGIGDDFNVVKLRTDAPRMSFLCYPDLENRAHPQLAAGIAIDLQTGKTFRTDYSGSLNPPILHRKELLLSPDHPRQAEYQALSEQEEAKGLYDDTAVIGFKANWERMLAARGLFIEGHSLREVTKAVQNGTSVTDVEVHRHKTAIARYTLSRPVKTLVEYSQLTAETSFFDYGCGLGADVRGLKELGYEAEGWDPVHQPTAEKRAADIVNLGYVLNVIEDPAERLATLLDAWHLTRGLLVVSTLVKGGFTAKSALEFGDGVLTKRGTFQKLFEQQELQQYLEDALEPVALPVALGVFYVFRDVTDQQRFLAARSRRPIDWDAVRLGLQRPERPERKPRVPREDVYAAHADLVEAFWEACITLGRLPLPTEFSRYSQVCSLFGSPKRALSGLQRRGRAEVFQSVQAARRDDLLVYLGAANLKRRLGFSHLPESVREDVRTFFGTYAKGLTEGLQLLHNAADPTTVRLACDDTSLGWQDDDALYLQTALIDRLPPVLRAYVACGEVLFGDARQADLVKIHKSSGKLTFLSYDDFESCSLPELQLRTKVSLRSLSMETYDHSGQGELLYFKDRFVAPEHPFHADLQELNTALRTMGVLDGQFLGPSLPRLQAMLPSTSPGRIVSQALACDSQRRHR